MIDLAWLGPWVMALVVMALLIAGYVLDTRRRERLMKLCLGRGWTYSAVDLLLPDRFQNPPFGRGENRRALNVITGYEGGRDFTAFDYSYDVRTTDAQGNEVKKTFRNAVCFVSIPATMPLLEVVPEGMFQMLAGAMGLSSDLDLESEDFNRAFAVRTNNPKFASDVLTPRTMEYLLTARPAAWRISGSELLWWHSGKLDPDEIPRAVAVLDQVAKGIPSFVWKDYKGPHG